MFGHYGCTRKSWGLIALGRQNCHVQGAHNVFILGLRRIVVETWLAFCGAHALISLLDHREVGANLGDKLLYQSGIGREILFAALTLFFAGVGQGPENPFGNLSCCVSFLSMGGKESDYGFAQVQALGGVYLLHCGICIAR